MEMEMEETTVSGGLHGNDSDVDLAAVAEKEYQRMKRQYFLMQKNRQSLMGKAGSSKTARSQKLVRVLESQKEELEKNISAATSLVNQRKDVVTKEKIWKLLQVYEKYKTQASKLHTDINAMERTMFKMTVKFYKAKLHIQNKMGTAVSIGRLERTIDNHENKLHMIKSNYDALMTENRELKNEIAVKINRRFIIFHRLDSLHRKMTECRHDLTNKVDEALQIYNIWDDAHKRINFIKEKYKDDVRQHLLEVKEYDRLLFHDLREIRFYSTKNKPRPLLEDEAQRQEKKSEQEVGQLLKEIKRYQKQFQRLEEFDRSQDVDLILNDYKLLEQQNFGNFLQISDFNKENILLMEEIHQLKSEVDILANETDVRDKSNEMEIMRLQLNRDAEREKLDYLKAQLDVNEESTQRIFSSIETFMESAECDTAPLLQLLGNARSTKITKYNLKAAFNLLEHHVTAIQLEKELLSIQKDIETHTSPSMSKPQKFHRPTGGPFEAKLIISGHPELGMEKKDDEEDTLFGAAPIPKSVQREHLLAQLRDSGVIAAPKTNALTESLASIGTAPGQPQVNTAGAGGSVNKDASSTETTRKSILAGEKTQDGGTESEKEDNLGTALKVKFGEKIEEQPLVSESDQQSQSTQQEQ